MPGPAEDEGRDRELQRHRHDADRRHEAVLAVAEQITDGGDEAAGEHGEQQEAEGTEDVLERRTLVDGGDVLAVTGRRGQGRDDDSFMKSVGRSAAARGAGGTLSGVGPSPALTRGALLGRGVATWAASVENADLERVVVALATRSAQRSLDMAPRGDEEDDGPEHERDGNADEG